MNIINIINILALLGILGWAFTAALGIIRLVRSRNKPQAVLPSPSPLAQVPQEGLWTNPVAFEKAMDLSFGVLTILPAVLDGKHIRLGVMHFGQRTAKILSTADVGQLDVLLCCHPELLPAEWKAKFIFDLPWSEITEADYLTTWAEVKPNGRVFCYVEDQFGFIRAANFPYVNEEEEVPGDDTEDHSYIQEEEVEGDETDQHLPDYSFFLETVSSSNR